MPAASANQFPKVILEERATDGSDTANPAADHRALFLGEDGALHLRDSAGTVTDVGGSGGITRSTLGTTSLGGSFDTTMKAIYKKITLATAGFLASIAVGVKGQSSAGANMVVGVLSDNAGTPLNIIAVGSSGATRDSTVLIAAFELNATARFIAFPVGVWLTAADYWIAAVDNAPSGNDVQYAFASGSGSDRTRAGTDGLYDHSVGASSSGTNDYSIYANILR